MPSRIRPTTPRTSANSSGTPRDPARRTAQLSLSRPSARPLNACALAVPAQASGPKSGAKSGASRPPSKGPPGTTTRPDPLDPTSAFFKVGIEAEFYLSGRNQEDISRFVKLLAIDYNEKHAFEHPRMRESLRPQNHDGDFAEWCLTLDDSVKSTSWPWGVELVSPIFLAFPGSRWRADVDVVWNYISENYKIKDTSCCGTHIHIGKKPNYTIRELKRISQAIIHFEPALEAMVPEVRRANLHAKSNWLDAPCLALKGLSRTASIAAIEEVPNDSHPNLLIGLMQPIDPGDPYNFDDRAYAWNLLSLSRTGSIEFRKPPASQSSIEALSWAEFALSFIQASCNERLSLPAMRKIPPTVGGIRHFLLKYGDVPQVNQPGRLNRLFQGLSVTDNLQPVPMSRATPVSVYRNTGEFYNELVTKTMEDHRRIRWKIHKAQGRYWK